MCYCKIWLSCLLAVILMMLIPKASAEPAPQRPNRFDTVQQYMGYLSDLNNHLTSPDAGDESNPPKRRSDSGFSPLKRTSSQLVLNPESENPEDMFALPARRSDLAYRPQRPEEFRSLADYIRYLTELNNYMMSARRARAG